jgi:cell wall-associated NlpC family hydrolase
LLLPLNVQSAYAEPTAAEKQAEADEVSARLAASETEMVQIGDDYRVATEAHDAAVAAMAEAQGRIDAAQAIITETQGRLGNRATQQYRQGPLSFLNVLFGAASFEEFLTSWDLINVINQENASLIQANKDARVEAKAAHAEYTAQEAVAAERLAETEAIKVRAEDLIAQQQAELNALSAEVAELVEKEQAARLAAEAEAAAAAAAAAAAVAQQNQGYVAPAFDPPPPPSGGYGDVVSAAASRLGCPYVYGASGPDSFDCSGLTSWSYSQAGRGYIGRTDSSQYASASARFAYSSGAAEPGDVLWWPGHVAIYVGGGSFIHAPVPGQTVCYSSWNIDNATVLRF